MTRSESIAHAIADRAEESGMSLPDFLADQAMMVMAQRLGDATRAALAQAFDDAAAPLPEKPREPTLSEMLETERRKLGMTPAEYLALEGALRRIP